MAILNVNSATDLVNALNNSVFGDEIVLNQTVLFRSNEAVPSRSTFKMPNKGVCPPGQEIVIRTNIPPEFQPRPGYRVRKDIDNAWFAKLQGPQVQSLENQPPLDCEPGANGYIIKWIQFEPGFRGRGQQINLGYNDASQVEYAQIPYNYRITQCYFRGDRLRGQRSGIVINADDVEVDSNYFYGINIHERLGNDATCIAGLNCRGPWNIYNNELVGGTEPWITAGDDPFIKFVATVSSADVNGAVLSTIQELHVGEHVAILTQGNTRREFRNVASINPTTRRVDWNSPTTVVPDIPGDVRWGVQLADVTFRRNYCWRPVAWRNAIIAPPTNLNHFVEAGGTFASGTYYWQVQAIADNAGNLDHDLFSDRSAEHQASLIANQRMRITWTASIETAVTGYRIYRYQKDTSGNIINIQRFETTSLTFTDTGAAGTSTTSRTNGDYWNIKNLGEVKTGVNVLIECNVMEYSWPGNDIGGCYWAKNNNQVSRFEWSRLDNVTMRWNLMRHCAAFMQLSGRRANTSALQDLPKSPDGFYYHNNLMYDSDSEWFSGTGINGLGITNSCHNVEIIHNTMIHYGKGAIALGSSNNNIGYFDNLKIQSNIFMRRTYGVNDIQSGSNQGTVALDKWGRPDAVSAPNYTFTHNIVAGASTSGVNAYPAGNGNQYPSQATFEAQFKNYAAGKSGNYRLKRISEGDDINSIGINAGHDGLDVGCDINTLFNEKLVGVIEGEPEGGVTPPPPTAHVQAEILALTTPAATGLMDLDFGFQTKAVLFIWGVANASGDDPHSAFGIGCAVSPTEQWAEYQVTQNNVALGDQSALKYSNACMVSCDFGAVLAMNCTFVQHTPTGCQINFLALPPSQRRFHAIGIAGTDISNVRAGIITAPAVVGPISYNVNLVNTTGLIFASMKNAGAGRPALLSGNSSWMLGMASSNLAQYCIAGRKLDGVATNNAFRYCSDEHCIVEIDNTQVIIRGALTGITANGFTIDWDVANGFQDSFCYLAIAGPRTAIKEINSPLATGIQDLNVGFGSELNLFLASGLSAKGLVSQHDQIMLGAMTDAEQMVRWSGMKNQTSGNQIARQAFGDSTVILHHNPTVSPSTQVLRAVKGADIDELSWSDVEPTSFSHGIMSFGEAPTGVRAELAAAISMSIFSNADLETSLLLQAAFTAETFFAASLTISTAIFRSLLEVYNLHFSLDVKREIDSGEVAVLASDAAGTLVVTNKPFKSLDSVTLTVLATSVRTATYTDKTANSFRIQVRDSAGNRADATVSWKVRGIV